MTDLLNMIAQTAPGQPQSPPAATGTFLDPVSIVVCTAGVCILISWMCWFDGFGALRKAPARRHRKQLVFWPLGIVVLWIAGILTVHYTVSSLFGSLTGSSRETVTYLLNAVFEIILIVAMMILANKLFARRLKGFGLHRTALAKDAILAAVNLVAVFPLIFAGLFLTLGLGRLIVGTDFSLEVHQSLEMLTDANPALRVMIFAFAVIIVPVFEELLFRGLFQTSLKSLSGSPWVGIVLTSVFFAVLHPPTHIAALFALSCGLGYAYERSGSLARPILMHLFFNGINVAMTLWWA